MDGNHSFLADVETNISYQGVLEPWDIKPETGSELVMDGCIRSVISEGDSKYDDRIFVHGCHVTEFDNDSIKNMPPVTLEEARNGLIKVLVYFKTHPPTEEIGVEILWKLLDHINNQASPMNKDDPHANEIVDVYDSSASQMSDEGLFDRIPIMDDRSSDNIRNDTPSDGESEKTETCLLPDANAPGVEASSHSQILTSSRNLRLKKSCISGRSKLKQRQSYWLRVKTPIDTMHVKHSKVADVDLVYASDDSDEELTSNIKRHNMKMESKQERDSKSISQMKIKNGKMKPRKPTAHSHICPICDGCFNSPGIFTRHMRRHKGKLQAHQCALCDVKCDTAKDLKKHMEGHKQHVCEECGRRFTCNGYLVKHMLLHTREQPHVCKFCEEKFDESEHLSEHIKIHTGVEPYTCTTCNQTFSKHSYLKDHLMLHGDDRPYKCTLCSKAYKQPNGLKVHSLKHQGIKEHMCSMCGKCFAEYSALQQHLVVHVKEKEHVCSTCGQTFARFSGLLQHLRKHTGEKPFACTACDKRFSLSSTLTKHMRVHTGQKPYTCETCGKQFTQDGNLRRHLVIHTGTKPYICSLCGQGYTQSSSRKQHMKNVHGIDGSMTGTTQPDQGGEILDSYV